jgi:hypothetical protein
MTPDRIKEYLQNYLDNVIIPKVNREFPSEENDGPLKMEVHKILKGSYQPTIYHVFIDVEPPSTLKSSLKKTENDIDDFFKVLSINNRIKVFWNKRPIFKDDNLV